MQGPESEIPYDAVAVLNALLRLANGEEAPLENPETDIPYNAEAYMEEIVPEAETPETELPYDPNLLMNELRRSLERH